MHPCSRGFRQSTCTVGYAGMKALHKEIKSTTMLFFKITWLITSHGPSRIYSC
jgi:hypothetical protein